MIRARRSTFLAVLLLAASGAAAAAAQGYTQPNVRAVTAFVRLDPADPQREIDAALAVLRAARAEFGRQGYQVQTLRLVTQPLSELVLGRSDADAFALLKMLGALAARDDFVVNVGPGMLRDTDDPRAMRLLAQGLSSLERISGSAIIAANGGIQPRVIRESAALVRYVTDHSPGSRGNFNFTAMAMMQPYGPFFPGTYHTGAGRQFSVGFESANVVQQVFARTHGDSDAAAKELVSQLTRHAKAAETVGQHVAAATGWTFMGVDSSPAPLADVSIGAAIETFTGARFGSSGTLSAALVITTAVKSLPVKLVGYSGLMLPVMEDRVLARRWGEDAFDIDSILAYSAVCGTGLDTVPLPGDVSEEQLGRIFSDVAALAFKWNKPLSARLQPIKDKRAGERTDFSGEYLFSTKLRPLR
jgi:uncharacterized protein (UPF0210 family)